jgi:hypothetical protein
VTGANGCESMLSYTFNDQFNYTSEISTTPANSSEGGAAEIIIEGGTAPFSFLWDNGSFSNMTEDLTPGPHTVIVTDGLGCQQEFSFEILLNTSTNELERLANVKSFPNPVESGLTIEWDDSIFKPTTLELFNVNGQKVKSKIITNQGFEKIDVSTLNDGLYIMILRNGKKTASQRIMKSKN